MEVDDGEVRRPGDLRDLGHAELVRMPAGREGHARGLDPLGPLLGHALLVDHLALDAVREAAQLRRPLVERTHDPLADREVVLDQVPLRLLPCRKEHLVRVRHLDGPAADLELDERRRHLPETVPRGRFEIRSARPTETAMRKLATLLLVLASRILAAGCGSDDDDASPARRRRPRRPAPRDGLRAGEPRDDRGRPADDRDGQPRVPAVVRAAARRRAPTGRSTTPPPARASRAPSPTPSPSSSASPRTTSTGSSCPSTTRSSRARRTSTSTSTRSRSRTSATAPSTSATPTTTSTRRSSGSQGTPIADVTSLADLADYQLGAQVGTTSLAVHPGHDPALEGAARLRHVERRRRRAQRQADRRDRRRPADRVLPRRLR